MNAVRAQLRGFTLVEMIVVMVIIGLLLTMIVPQLTGNPRRQFMLTVDQVGDLLTMYAQREMLGQKIVGISHDKYDNSLVLMTLDSPDLYNTARGEWRRDLFVKPVRFPTFMHETDVEIQADGERLDTSQIPLSNEPGKDRPTIQIALRGANENAVLVLNPYSIAPEIITGTLNTTTGRDRVDLDATGRSREDW
jgi:prepilin-type N-terminal cleavage/methylation domain-containing protein